jgi:hypothetical protein
MPKDAHDKAMKEIQRLEMMPPMSAESTVSRTYLDWLIAMPWDKKSREIRDIRWSMKVLEEDHYGLEKDQGPHHRVPSCAQPGQETSGYDPLLCRGRRASARPRWPSPSPSSRLDHTRSDKRRDRV